MTLTQKVYYMIFKDSISDYKLGNNAHVLEQSINRVHIRQAKLGNMSLKNAQRIGNYFDKIHKTDVTKESRQ